MAGKNSVFFHMKIDDLSCERFMLHVRHHLQSHLRPREYMELVHYVSGQGCIEAQVDFSNSLMAREVQGILSRQLPEAIITLNAFPSETLIFEIQEFQDAIITESQRLNEEHSSLDVELQARIDELEKIERYKKLNLDQVPGSLEEKDAIKRKLDESHGQTRQFRNFYVHILQEISTLKQKIKLTRVLNHQKFLKVKQSFKRESQRFSKALPIYARKKDILEVVKKNQVTVLVGETGSGKSTQIVQYLYEEGFAKMKRIVCTQPRKVAAITLAEYVSGEMFTELGTIVGYKVGAINKSDTGSPIVYMTDHVLLNECITDRNFSEFSCLVIDEAHERNLNTDILLAFIKQCLPLRPDLRVIITSATIDPELFVKYFNGCPVVKVSGRTFPVEVTWNPLSISTTETPLTRNYLTDSIDVATTIHKKEPEGDILVFLTAQREIEEACILVKEDLGDSVVVLPLYGSLPPEEQQKVFKEYPGKRKIIFSTNVAETSVTITGIKYIVDTGVAKELCFNQRKNMNSLEVRIISRSSADQRKGRAGRVSAGKCYRLYSEQLYKDMSARSRPEILRVHLTHAVLKLYEFGVPSILDFDFVEKPDCLTLREAINTLNFLGAIDEVALTAFGKQLALLPIDPSLGKILLDGIEQGVGLETAVAVSVSSSGGNVFFRGGTEEMKKQSDQKRIPFLHIKGDQITSLVVYKEWVAVEKLSRNIWCFENYINAKTMRAIEETVKELLYIVKQKMKTHVQIKPLDIDAAQTKVLRLFFNTFINNVCIFLGHERAGYMTTRMPGVSLVVFPGSGLLQCNNFPKYLVFEKTLKTSQHFLLQALHVEESWVTEALARGKLNSNADIELKKYMVVPLTFSNIGPGVYKHVTQGNLRIFSEEMKSVCHEFPVAIDSNPDCRLLSIFAPQTTHNEVRIVVEKKINEARSKLKKEYYETGVTKIEDDVKVVLSCGGCIKYILMPGEYRTLICCGSTDGKWIASVSVSMKEIGEVEKEVSRIFTQNARLYVTFADPVDASRAALLKAEGVTIQPQVPRTAGEQGTKLFRLRVEWTRREQQDYSFLDFNNVHDRDRVLQHSRIIVGCRSVRLKPSKKASFNKDTSLQVYVTGTKQVTREGLTHAVTSVTGITDFKVTIGCEKSFVTTEEKMQSYHHQLEYLIKPCVSSCKCRINLLPVKDHYTNYLAFVDFEIPEEGHAALTALQHRDMYGKCLKVEVALSSSIRYPLEIYKAIKDDVEDAKQQLFSLYGDVIKISERQDKHSNVFIEITSRDIKAFSMSKVDLQAAILPVVVECNNPVQQHFILSKGCQQNLIDIQAATSTIIKIDLRTMTLKIYGTRINCKEANEALKEKMLHFEKNGITVHDILLKESGCPPGLMKHIVLIFGIDLEGIKNMPGVEAAVLDPRRQVLSILANTEAYDRIMSSIRDYSPPQKIYSAIGADIPECCACLTDIDDRDEIFRLEYCGHAYHTSCIELQTSQQAIRFPLLCAAEECGEPFVWNDIESMFKKTSLTKRHLVDHSLRSYIAANSAKIKNCLTPDCKMVYVSSEEGKLFMCGCCGLHICTKCHVQYHDGLSCAMARAAKDGDKELKQWMDKSSDRKHCPNPECKSPIEKIDGCNKVTCTSCNHSICWVCVKYFQTEQDCYAHLKKEHGSFD